MKTLIISDIHERHTTLRAIEDALFPEADRIVFLGDFFDTFGKRIPATIAAWIKTHIDDSRIDWLWGNHDVHYAFPFGQCSGYDYHTQSILNEMMPPEIWRKFKPWVTVGPFLVSHAGFVKETLHLKNQAQDAVSLAFEGKRHEYWNAGVARGGSNAIGGPVWLDWNFEFEPMSDIPQIVGHTVITQGPPKQKGNSWCLDTCNRHVMWVDEETGNVTIEAVC